MAPMQPISKSARARSGPTEEFVELCKTLYGDAVDPEVVWGDVIKLSPDQADLHANRNAKIRRNVERASNAVGITAGTLGLAGALKDDRLDPEKNPSVGRVGRTLHRTGQKMPKMLSRIQNKKVQAGLATAAVGTQLANLGGDALIAGTLGKKPAKARRRKSDYALAKRGNPAAVPRDLRPQVQGLRKLWKTPAGNTLAPTGGVSKGWGSDVATGIVKPIRNGRATTHSGTPNVARQRMHTPKPAPAPPSGAVQTLCSCAAQPAPVPRSRAWRMQPTPAPAAPVAGGSQAGRVPGRPRGPLRAAPGRAGRREVHARHHLGQGPRRRGGAVWRQPAAEVLGPGRRVPRPVQQVR